MAHALNKMQRRSRRKFRIRKKIDGASQRPRLSVFRSLQHIYVQAIDDTQGKTLASASTVDKELRSSLAKKSGNAQAASVVGENIAKRLKKLGVSQVVFDRNGNIYHGRIKVLAEAARKQGLQF